MTRLYTGWKKQQPDIRDRKFAVPCHMLRAMPPRVDLRSRSIMSRPFEPNWDQGNLGSCGPHAAGEALVFDMLTIGQTPIMPSRLFIYYATRYVMGTVSQDSGVDNRSLMKALSQFGWCDESQWPYDISKFTKQPPATAIAQAATRKVSGYLAVPQGIDTIRGCIAGGKPFVLGFTVYESFESNAVEATGIVPMPGTREQVLGGHDVLAIGYDDTKKQIICRNSWGDGWGDNGDFYMPYDYVTSPDLAGDYWTIPSDGMPAPLPPSPPPTPTPTPTPPPPPSQTYKFTVQSASPITPVV